MSSTNTYTEQKYCVYITHYSENKLPSKNNSAITPSNYIGTTSVDKINNGYKGSVSSKKYKTIWESELKNNPQLFSVEIISYHDTRPEATYKELQLQRIFNVVKNPLFINMAYASINGCHGMDVSGKLNQFTLTSIKYKAKLTKLIKYDNQFFNNHDKTKQTLYTKTGYEYALQNPVSKEKQRKTNLERNGSETYCNPEKIKQTKLIKYGIESYNNREKSKQTSLLLYGYDNPSKIPFLCIIANKKVYSKNILSRWYPELKKYY